jgi:hypothetical protein
MQMPVTVLNANTKRETGKKAQEGNIAAAKVGQAQQQLVLWTGGRCRRRCRRRDGSCAAVQPHRRRSMLVLLFWQAVPLA